MKKNDPAPETAPQPSAPKKPETHTVEPKSGGSVTVQIVIEGSLISDEYVIGTLIPAISKEVHKNA